jgi:SAM-dependent methyltransferase
MNMRPGSSRRTSVRQHLRRALRPVWPPMWRRTAPVSTQWGYDRGHPVDRYYIERFVRQHASDIHGDVMEVKEPLYATRYGSGIAQLQVLDVDGGNPDATLVCDITRMSTVAEGAFDCCVVTQTLQYVYDVAAAVRELHRVLRVGGVLLVTVPAITRVDASADYADYWRFTVDSCTRLFGDTFGRSHVTVAGHGNVLASIAFLQGLAQEELTRSELDTNDPLFPLVITVRTVKAGAA